MEKFVPINDMGCQYFVGNKGSVLSRKKGGRLIHLKPMTDYRGYQTVELHGKQYFIHRLVAIHFIPNPENKATVNHKDEDKKNNRIENLEWMTNTENHNYGTRNERVGKAQEKPILRISKETGEVLQRYARLKDAVADGYNHSSVSRCANGIKLKSSGGYIWRWEADYNRE